jgi:hypothetical protein
MSHIEFPRMTSMAVAAYNAALAAWEDPIPDPDEARPDPDEARTALAAFLREAMRQAAAEGAAGGRWGHLEAIANNLHSPPPPPPTLAQAREAARQLGGANAEVVHAFLATLREGEP